MAHRCDTVRIGIALVALLALPACVKVENLSPATAQTAKLKGGYLLFRMWKRGEIVVAPSN